MQAHSSISHGKVSVRTLLVLAVVSVLFLAAFARSVDLSAPAYATSPTLAGSGLPITYYTGYTADGYNGGVFYRSVNPINETYPSATLSESYSANALNLALTQTNNDGYDLGFYFMVGTIGSLAASGVTIIGSGFTTNLWVNPAAWTWTPIGVGDQFSGLGSSGAYGLGSASGTQTIIGATTFSSFSGACTGALTVAAIAAGACPGITTSTPVAIWVGITLFAPGASSGSVSITAASTTTSTQTSTSTVTSTSTATTASPAPPPECATGLYSGYYTDAKTNSSVSFANVSYSTALALVTQNPPGGMGCESASTIPPGNAPVGTSLLTVDTVDQSGNAITGYYTVLDQNGGPVGTGFSPAAFTVSSGVSYAVGVQDYGSCHFDHWTDTGSTDRQRTFTASSGAQTMTAMYDCGTTTTTSGGTSTITVSGVSSSGSTMTGYYATLWQNGAMVQSCFTSCSFTVSNGQTYQVAVADYGNEAFSHWSDGTLARFHTVVVPGSATAVSLTAVYSP